MRIDIRYTTAAAAHSGNNRQKEHDWPAIPIMLMAQWQWAMEHEWTATKHAHGSVAMSMNELLPIMLMAQWQLSSPCKPYALWDTMGKVLMVPKSLNDSQDLLKGQLHDESDFTKAQG